MRVITLVLFFISQSSCAEVIKASNWRGLLNTGQKNIEAFAYKSAEIISSSYDEVSEFLPITIEENSNRDLFDLLPNSITLVPFAYQNINTSIDGSGDDKLIPRFSEISELHYLKGVSISKTYRPKKYWAWDIKFSPTLSYINYTKKSELKVLHASYGPSLLWHLPKHFGTFEVKAGLGLIWLNGSVYGREEKNKLTWGPNVKGSYYNFFTKKFFAQIKYKQIFLIQKPYFAKSTYNYTHYVESLVSLSLNFGYKFDNFF